VTHRLIYVIGEPGSGKTTAVDAFCSTYVPLDIDTPVPHRAWLDGPDLAFVTLGRHRPPFSGTDTLAMNVQPTVTTWLTHPSSPPIVLAEGDRLGNGKFFDAMLTAQRDLTVVHLATDPDLAAQRRADRSARSGTVQNPTWVAGRRTKVARLVETYDVVRINGNRPVDEIAADLANLLDV
jgi:adenylate kinase family enzyme